VVGLTFGQRKTNEMAKDILNASFPFGLATSLLALLPIFLKRNFLLKLSNIPQAYIYIYLGFSSSLLFKLPSPLTKLKICLHFSSLFMSKKNL
jgi:hypothetical protein